VLQDRARDRLAFEEGVRVVEAHRDFGDGPDVPAVGIALRQMSRASSRE